MSDEQKTHREVKTPQMSARHLADYMAASERVRRTITRNCKYQPIARVVQHDEAKLAVARHIRDGKSDTDGLLAQAKSLRERMADSDFDRDLLDHNADYIERFAEVFPNLNLPAADRVVPGKVVPVVRHGVRITAEIHLRLRRLIKTTNKIRVGAVMLRYAKGKALSQAIADWQAAFLYGYLRAVGVEEGAEVEHKLCVVIDAYSGIVHPAPTNSASRFHNMDAACATIAERWPNIKPPPGARF
jgi:hypothetical protein